MLENLREELFYLHQELINYRLVAWTSGNISARDHETGLIVIKPSGIKYEKITPKSMVIVDSEGKRVEGEFAPSVDLPSHLFIYKNRKDIFGIVHTHSCFATAFAAVGKPIPVVLTAIADEFGKEIPCAEYAPIGSEAIGKSALMHLENSKAVLLKSHGVLTVGNSAESAVKTAVFVEDIARTVYYAMQLGEVVPFSEEETKRAHLQYKNFYGQKKTLLTSRSNLL